MESNVGIQWQSKREIEEKDYSKWEVKELKPDSYDGVLYFSYFISR